MKERLSEQDRERQECSSQDHGIHAEDEMDIDRQEKLVEQKHAAHRFSFSDPSAECYW